MLLGGSAAQLIAIQKAKELGYHTVVCDYLEDNPGQYEADAFYLVSTTDKDAILKVAQEEKIDGIVAYSSDPAAPTAAYVAEKMGLPGIRYDLAKAFCEKQLFRKFLSDNGFNTPKSIKIEIPYNFEGVDIDGFHFPVIVKPTDSSGSKGVTVLYDKEGLSDALDYASKYSRNGTLIIEEFIQRDHPFVIEAEIFVIDGVIVSWGLINSIRDKSSNPLLPAAYSYPLELPEQRELIVRSELSKLIGACGKVFGAFNIEMIIDESDRLFFIDAGPRNGGNMLPEFMTMISGKDIVAATIKNAMGETTDIDVELDGKSGGFWGMGVLHTSLTGNYSHIDYSKEAKRALIREEIQKKIGDKVVPFDRCNDLVGLSFFKFDSLKEMDDVMCNMQDSMKVILS